jgi:hypothetical protein
MTWLTHRLVVTRERFLLPTYRPLPFRNSDVRVHGSTKSSAIVWLLIWFAPAAGVAADAPPCDKGAPQSEFSWNPPNSFVTPRLARFYQLGDGVQAAYERANDVDLAERAKEWLELAAVYRCNWNYGNAIHDGNRYLGLASLRAGKVDEAANFLVLASKSTGSPQLDTFGPELNLADALLKRGKTQAVTEYLQGIHQFWGMDNGQVDRWIAAINKGERPELERFTITPSPWLTAFDWLVAALPAVITLTLLYAGRHRLRKKVVFVVVAMGLGYGTWFLMGYAMTALWVRVLGVVSSAGRVGEYVFVYLPVVLLVVVPALVVFWVFRYLSPRRPCSVE